ncbi:LysE family translocator [Flavihumibacter profundi]|uniref:LysE family translocator n=1 Tax=Flavihumibacter profundi TaxID=2716883 RepID=UPI001CC49594|nr:LysE family transporter [Flavihumibacter profundi]MBZ5855842.1 LysE family transporter [Flavihumibacter profundi]
MNYAIEIFTVGMVISFLGSIPLGILNITAMQISVQESVQKAMAFAFGVSIIELLFVRVSLKGIDFLLANQRVFYFMEWLSVILFLVLAISNFNAAKKEKAGQKSILLSNTVNRFWLGISMSAINPLKIPFWFLWSGYFLSIHLLQSTSLSFNIYTLGIGTGTIAGMILFIFGGKWLVRRLNTGQRALNLIVGLVFLVSAIIQFARVMVKPMEQQLKVPTEQKR